MEWKTIKSWLLSAAMASAILFGYGHHPTVDAIIVTVVWMFLIIAGVAVAALAIGTFAIWRNDRRFDRDLGDFYKNLSEMHQSWPKKLVGFVFIGYWLYALVVQEWTVTAVYYVILTIFTQLFVFATRNLAKEFFLAQLKGKGARTYE